MARKKIEELKQAEYRINIVKENSHKTVFSFKSSKFYYLVWGVTFVLAAILAIYSAIAFTPLRMTIPGYPDAHARRQAVTNAIKIDSLENAITRWKIYSDNLDRVLRGEETIEMDSLLKGGTTRYLSDKGDEFIRRQDSLLRTSISNDERFEVDGRKERDLPVEGLQFFNPLKGALTREYDPALHAGVDITAPSGAAVKSVLDGTVLFSGWSDQDGYTVVIQHENNIISIYKHNQQLLRQVGEIVSAGTPVALLGGTGTHSSGDYLHFELWYKGKAVNPARYISFQ